MAGDSCARLKQVARRRTRRELEGPDPRDAELHWSSCECLNRSRRQPSGLREHLNQDSRRDHGVARKMPAKKPVLRRSRTTTTRTHTRDQIHDLLDESHRRLVREEVDRQLHARSIQCRATRERPDDRMSDPALTALFLLQVAVILAFCRAVGWAARFVGQPQVVAEMIAGFLIGPSVFGWLVPDLQRALFPAESLHSLYVCSQVGLALYMFVVGLEFRTALLRAHARRAATVSIVGMVVPFALGGVLGFIMQRSGGFFAGGISGLQALLFVGAAMSITAFPMLARIIYELGMAGTALGTLVLAAGAINDAAAWIVLATVLGSLSTNTLAGIWPLVGGAAYALTVLVFARPLLRRLTNAAETRGTVAPWQLPVMLAALAAGACFTETAGIHAVFGAFVLGVAVPRGVFTRYLRSAIEPLTTGLLLPLFFVYTGLNTRLALVNSFSLWMMTLLLFGAACAGKGLACWMAARWSGSTREDAMGIGALMNARGMMELILLSVGLERGVITPVTYTMLVLMTIATTLMAYPLFGVVYRRVNPLGRIARVDAPLTHPSP